MTRCGGSGWTSKPGSPMRWRSGQGEPLANYAATVKALRLLNADYGLQMAARHLTISTSGVVPAIYRLADEGLQLNLALSLHATSDELRSQLIPLNRTYLPCEPYSV